MTSSPYLDLDSWPRRSTFEHFRGYGRPHFSLCVRLDVGPLKRWLTENDAGGVIVACHWLTLRLAMQIEPLRYRFEQGRVRVHSTLQASTTVLRDDGSIGFARLPWIERFADFAPMARAAIAAQRRPQGFNVADDDTDVLHFTTLPWVHFTSFTHARSGLAEDSIPKFAFGRFEHEHTADRERWWMPLSLEVHHALMDGLHAGQFVQGFEQALAEPAAVFASR